ncbi:MAG: AAA family ATPase, partial [Candidatus Baltobacteraceae bacterium]
MNRVRTCTIEDFGLIARARVTFADGLTAFSGETGSGKTMLLGALRFALGDRTSTDLVRAGAERARVTLEIEADDALRARMNGDGFELELGEDAIVVRELARNGRTAARVNGRPATGAQLRAYAEEIVEVVGQHEAQRLLAPAYQLELLDRFAGAAALEARGCVGSLHARVAELERDVRELEANDARALAAVEEARYAVGEIDATRLSVDEEAGARERRDYLANAERIALALDAAYDALAGSDGSAGDALGAATSSVAGIAAYGARLRELAGRLAGAQSEIADIAGALVREREATEFDSGESERLGARLDVIERLKRKYGESLAHVLAERDRLASVVENFEGRDARLAALRETLATAGAELR